MTSRERVMAALAHREPDRTPMFEYVLQPPVADALLGRPYQYRDQVPALINEIGWEPALRRHAADVVDLAARLGHDLIYVWSNPGRPPPTPAPAAPPPPAFTDPVEEMQARVARAETYTQPPEDWFLIIRLLRETMAQRGLDLPILVPACGHGVWTDTALMQTMALEPELARRHFQLATRWNCWMIDRFLEAGADLVQVGGDFAGNRGPLVSPAMYREFMMPEVRAVTRHVHAAGRYAINASDGDLWSVIDDFLIATEVDGYNEIDVRAGMDLGELKRRFGARITFFGNIDCANLLSFGTPAQVRAHTRECLQKGWGGGGHILCCNNAITASVPLANYRAIGEAYREYFGL